MVQVLRFLLLILPFGLQAQFNYVLDQSIPVRNGPGAMLLLPWAGGLNAAHYNTLDLNGDGREDLVLYDRMGDKISTFLNLDNLYHYAPEYETFFPKEITNWLLLRDYNCDGRKDIFTGNILGIKVYINVTTSGGNLSWEEVSFYSGSGGSKSPVLLTKGFSGKINLQLQFDDLPSIVDADGDGDLDIFNVRFVGQGTVEYHQNFSMERYGTCDSLDFERITQAWGNFKECGCADFAFNGENCGSTGGRVKHAGGKSLLMLDIDANGSLDALFSEADCNNLYALPNEGTTASPVINSYNNFPQTTPVDFLIFPAPFYEDVDFDGRKDLIAVPNIFSKTPETLNADLANSNWVYKNNGTNEAPNFSFSTKSFLQNEMIDVGDNAVPAFIDYDGDGDQDMFISRNTSENSRATVRLYENVGSSDLPFFSLQTEDAFGFSSLPYYNLKIQFADIDHDGKRDLVFTATSLLNGQTKLYYRANKSNSGLDLSGQDILETSIAIISSENVSVIDVDNDGYQDLLIGKSNGALQFWKNQRSGVSFALVNEAFLGFNANIVSQNITCTAADLDSDGKTDLVLGDQRGILHIVRNFSTASDTTGQVSNIIFNPLNQTYASKNLGGRIWPTTTTIFNSSRPAIVVGNTLGGIHVLRNDDSESLPKEPVITIYPNPVITSDGSVTIEIDRPAKVQVFNSLGQAITTQTEVPGFGKYTFEIPFVNSGVYFLRFNTQGKSSARRLVILRP